MKRMEERKEGRERLLLAAQEPGPEQGPRIAGRDRDPDPSVRSGGERSFPPVGNRIPRFALPGSLRPFFFRGEHASLPSLLRGLRFPPSSLSPGVGGNPHSPSPERPASLPPSLPQGRNAHLPHRSSAPGQRASLHSPGKESASLSFPVAPPRPCRRRAPLPRSIPSFFHLHPPLSPSALRGRREALARPRHRRAPRARASPAERSGAKRRHRQRGGETSRRFWGGWGEPSRRLGSLGSGSARLGSYLVPAAAARSLCAGGSGARHFSFMLSHSRPSPPPLIGPARVTSPARAPPLCSARRFINGRGRSRANARSRQRRALPPPPPHSQPGRRVPATAPAPFGV